MTHWEQLVKWVFGTGSGYDGVQKGKALRAIKLFTDDECATFMALSEDLRQERLNEAIVDDAPFRTERELLMSALPQHPYETYSECKSMPRRIYIHEPVQVKQWQHLQPDNSASPLLLSAIISRQKAANHTKRRFGAFARGVTAIGNVASVEPALLIYAANPLSHIAQAAGEQVCWKQQPIRSLDAAVIAKVIADKTAAHSARRAAASQAVLGPSGTAVEQSVGNSAAEQSVSNSAAADHVPTRSHGQPEGTTSFCLPEGSSGRASSDFISSQRHVFMLSSTRAATEASSNAASSATTAAAPMPKCYCLGEINGVHVLMHKQEGVLTPVNLCEAWNDGVQPVHSMVSQLYTYMYSQGICFGFISCYCGTWIVNCPSSNPGVMYVSNCLMADTSDSTTTPAATAMGALTLLQKLALSSSDVFTLPDSPPSTGAAADISSKDQHRGSTALGCSPQPLLVIGSMLCFGSVGPVYEGRYGDVPAVVKMMYAGEPAYEQEKSMYEQLHAKQGELVPCLLAAGPAADGINFIAIERIIGVPLSSLQRVPEPVGAAALAALRSLASAYPGFLHGDIRLQNVLVVGDIMDSTPRCMWIDFGQSSMDGTKQEQLAEEAELKSRLHG